MVVLKGFCCERSFGVPVLVTSSLHLAGGTNGTKKGYVRLERCDTLMVPRRGTAGLNGGIPQFRDLNLVYIFLVL